MLSFLVKPCFMTYGSPGMDGASYCSALSFGFRSRTVVGAYRAATCKSHHSTHRGTTNMTEAEAASEVTPMPGSGKQTVEHAAKAWAFFKSLGSPKYHVAPMVDQSELPFRMLCRENGATCAYSPMLHARLFAQDPKYRTDCWSTCPTDRPLLAQFCANDPNYLVQAAKLIEKDCDAIDINFGCPQRIAKRGFYGAFLMEDLSLIEQLVKELSQGISIPVTCKIRIFPEIEKTLAYARMVERSGCSILAVHGRTRDQKDNSGTRADWDAIKAVKEALSIPVLANGNIRNLKDADACMAYTGCDGVLSAESLLEDPALFSPSRALPGQEFSAKAGVSLLRDYLRLAMQYPVPNRMIKGHIHKLIGPWLSEHHDLRDRVNCGGLSLQGYLDEVVEVLEQRVKESGRLEPIPKLSDRAQKRLEKDAMIKVAIEEQQREESAVAALASTQEPTGTEGAVKEAAGEERGTQDSREVEACDQCCEPQSLEHVETGEPATAAAPAGKDASPDSALLRKPAAVESAGGDKSLLVPSDNLEGAIAVGP